MFGMIQSKPETSNGMVDCKRMTRRGQHLSGSCSCGRAGEGPRTSKAWVRRSFVLAHRERSAKYVPLLKREDYLTAQPLREPPISRERMIVDFPLSWLHSSRVVPS